ncbi:MAG: carbohydrate binding family 9 domain-containing protein [Gemmatimonadetes bacterium]|nr:carbohydrate binding family 9 domain-containing protein [Gemmatimonadota bacterium]
MRRQFRVFVCAAVTATAAASAVGAQQSLAGATPPASRTRATSPAEPLRGTAMRTATAPVIDGKDTDAAWRDAPLISDFLEYEPNPGADLRFKTELRVLYDDRYLYVLGRMHDPAPDSIISLLSRRDTRTESEQLKLVIDSYHDGRTAYQFITNPAGVKRDFYVYNDQIEDPSWDAVWDVGTSIDEHGWVAEFRIPFSQIRFNGEKEKTFGLLAVRDVARTRQRISWPLYQRNRQGYVSQAGVLVGISDIPEPRRMEFTPYLVGKTFSRLSGNKWGMPSDKTIGGDAKIGLASNLTLDATMNPDFGQVEADPAVLNLSAFEQFYSERRPFFIEGAGIYQFGPNCGDGGDDAGCPSLFYSRRIGRAPQLAGRYGDASSPTATRILGATKLSGRFANGLSIGVMDAMTEGVSGPGGKTLEPRTNYGVARVRQEFGRGQGDIGAVFTATDRSLDSWSEPYLRSSAYTGGIDGRRRLWSNNYELRGFVAVSRVAGSAAAIASTQRSSVHQYQRPDAGLRYDPNRTSLTGDWEAVSFSKFGGGMTRFSVNYDRTSPGFEMNDVGFQSRADQQNASAWYQVAWQRPGPWYRMGFLNFNHYRGWTTNGLPVYSGGNVNGHVQFKNTMWAHLGINLNNIEATYDDRRARGGPAVRNSPSMNFWAGVDGDQRKWYTPNVFFGGARGDAGRSHHVWVNPSVNMRASSRFSAELGMNLSKGTDATQWRGNYGVIGSDTTHYTFAKLKQTTLGVTTRLNLTATPELTLQFYAQPFVTTGTYSDWKQLGRSRAASFTERYVPYNGGDPGGFNFRQFRSNTVLRWEYMPGSALFLVWQQGREAYDAVATNFDFGRDPRDLFGLHPQNTFLVKLSYWLNP